AFPGATASFGSCHARAGRGRPAGPRSPGGGRLREPRGGAGTGLRTRILEGCTPRHGGRCPAVRVVGLVFSATLRARVSARALACSRIFRDLRPGFSIRALGFVRSVAFGFSAALRALGVLVPTFRGTALADGRPGRTGWPVQ